MRHFDERLRPLGLSMAYLHVAITIQGHGSLQQKDLLRFVHVEQPTMAALLKRWNATVSFHANLTLWTHGLSL